MHRLLATAVALPLLAGQLSGGFALAQPAKGSGVINIEQRRQVRYDSYVLGPGDGLQIEVIDIPELSGTYSIGPDGTLYLPRLRAVYASGLTIETLRSFLTQQYTAFVKRPRLYVRPVAYRPIRVYVGGEVKRPGYYQLSGIRQEQVIDEKKNAIISSSNSTNSQFASKEINLNPTNFTQVAIPTVYDAIRQAQGVGPFADLSKVSVTRKLPEESGGGKAITELNFFSSIINGNDSQNIMLFDEDRVIVGKSSEIIIDQLLKVASTNLSPQFVEVFVSGRVKAPGAQILPQPAVLNQALISSGGLKFLKGKIEFIRFNRDGLLDRRIFTYSPNATSGSYENPVLVSGDIIKVNESVLTGTLDVISEITSPFSGIFGTYSLIKGVGGF